MSGKRARATRHKGVFHEPGSSDASVDAASERDRVYFETHPDATVYYRKRIPGEYGPREEDEAVRNATYTRVTQIRRGYRTRGPCALLLRRDYPNDRIPFEHFEAFVSRFGSPPFFVPDEQIVEE